MGSYVCKCNVKQEDNMYCTMQNEHGWLDFFVTCFSFMDEHEWVFWFTSSVLSKYEYHFRKLSIWFGVPKNWSDKLNTKEEQSSLK